MKVFVERTHPRNGGIFAWIGIGYTYKTVCFGLLFFHVELTWLEGR
jgi:hypothetical protein